MPDRDPKPSSEGKVVLKSYYLDDLINVSKVALAGRRPIKITTLVSQVYFLIVI